MAGGRQGAPVKGVLRNGGGRRQIAFSATVRLCQSLSSVDGSDSSSSFGRLHSLRLK